MASKFDDIPTSISRFSDFPSKSKEILPPIPGFDDQSLVSLKEAVKPLISLVPEIDHMVWTVERNCNQSKDDLSVDESASIMLYTLEWGPPARPFYTILNETLRSRNRRLLLPWSLYLRLFTHALSKLPPSSHRIIYRGIKMDITNEYSEGNEIVWWSFSSCTSSIKVLENYIGKVGNRTIFNITFNSAKDISRHSYYPEEKEVLLYPARQFTVKSLLDTGNELHIIHIEETEPPFPLFRMLLTEKSNLTSSTDQFINILLVGEARVGKSTFINALVNHLKYETLEQAQSHQLTVLKPLSFDVCMEYDNYKSHTVKFGIFDNHSQSTTKCCQVYTFNLDRTDGKKLCLIDTPSFHNEQNSDEDNSNNIKHILKYVNNLTHLNAICFLLKPNQSMLQNSFQLCFSQLLNQLGVNARTNVIFCFTHARTNYYMPGKTVGLLRTMFNSFEMSDFPLNQTNTFLLDNESFRYIIAVQNEIRFDNKFKADYTKSWLRSVKESNRLLNYICTQLIPIHIIKKQ